MIDDLTVAVDKFHWVGFSHIANNAQWNIIYKAFHVFDMTFTDKQMFEAIDANEDVKECFNRIIQVCKDLKSRTGCPNDDVDEFLQFTIGKWSDF